MCSCPVYYKVLAAFKSKSFANQKVLVARFPERDWWEQKGKISIGGFLRMDSMPRPALL